MMILILVFSGLYVRLINAKKKIPKMCFVPNVNIFPAFHPFWRMLEFAVFIQSISMCTHSKCEIKKSSADCCFLCLQFQC